MITCANIEAALWHHLPADLHGVVPVLAQVLADAATGAMSPADAQAHFAASPERISALRALAGHEVTAGGTLIAFGAGNQIGTVLIGDVAGGNIVKLALTVGVVQSVTVSGQATVGSIIGTQHIHAAPSPAERDQKLRALLHDHSGFIASRMESFVGRAAELAEIRARIAEKLPTGGYVTITGQAGQGKSSVIAKLIADAIGDMVAIRERLLDSGVGVPICHFIPFSPGPDHQVGLLRNLLARLCLIYALPDFYATSDSRPALRDYFAAALRNLVKQGKQEIIYIDGLDQIEEDASGVRDLSFLPVEPPAGIVFVLGTRPNDTLKPLELRKPQHEYWLPSLSRADFDLILSHRGVTLSSPLADRFYAAMQENALYLDLVARELAQADSIEPEQIIARVADNPASLFSLSIERLQRNERQWDTVLRPILGLLLAARAPLSQRALRALIGADDLRTKQGLQRLGGLVQRDGEGCYGLFHLKLGDYLRQGVFAADEEEGYHQQLVSWCEGGKGGIGAIWQDAPGDVLEQERRAYARQHYIAHLAAARAYERLWEVIDVGAYGAAKRRYDPSTRSYALDLDIARQAGVDVAGGVVDAQARELPRLWKYSLLRCSLTSQAENYPEELFLALVALGRSDEAINLAELLSDPLKKTKTLRVVSAALLERGGDEGIRILQQARATADAVPDTSARAIALIDLAIALTQVGRTPDANATFAQARTTAKSIPDANMQTAILSALATALAQAGEFALARTTAFAIHDTKARVVVLSTLTSALAQAGQFTLARATAFAIPDTQALAVALSNLAAVLAQAGRASDATIIFTKAHAVAKTVGDKQSQINVLCALAAAFAQAGRASDAATTFAHARATADAIVPYWDGFPADAFRTLTIALAQTGQFALARTAVDAIDDTQLKADALRILATALAQAGHATDANATFVQARAATDAIPNTENRIDALRIITTDLIQASQFVLARAATDAMPNVGDQASFLCTLATALAHAGRASDAAITFTHARTMTDAIPDTRTRAVALCALATALAQDKRTSDAITAFDYARAAIDDILNIEDRAVALCTLATALAQAEQFDLARTTTDAIPDSRARVVALSKLATILAWAGQFAQAHATADAIPDTYARAGALLTLATVLAQAGRVTDATTIFVLARTAMDAIPDAKARAAALCTLATALDQAGYTTDAATTFALIRTTVEVIPDVNVRDVALGTLATALAQAGEFAQSHATADAISDLRARATALCALATSLAQAGRSTDATTTFTLAHIAANTIPVVGSQAAALRTLATALAQAGRVTDATTIFAQARAAIDVIPDASARAIALRTLATALTQAGHATDATAIFAQARTATDAISDASARSIALRTLATALTQAGHATDAAIIFAQARTTTDVIPDVSARAAALRSLATALNKVGLLLQSAALLAALWCRAQTRDELLGLFAIPPDLLRAYPELGQGFLDSFAWVDAQLATG